MFTHNDWWKDLTGFLWIKTMFWDAVQMNYRLTRHRFKSHNSKTCLEHLQGFTAKIRSQTCGNISLRSVCVFLLCAPLHPTWPPKGLSLSLHTPKLPPSPNTPFTLDSPGPSRPAFPWSLCKPPHCIHTHTHTHALTWSIVAAIDRSVFHHLLSTLPAVAHSFPTQQNNSPTRWWHTRRTEITQGRVC